MKTISAKFLSAVVAFAAAFSALILYGTWSSTRANVEQLFAREAELALEFDLAIREYVADHVRPSMHECVGEDRFFPETMSTSFVARSIFDRVRETFPDYIIKFSSVNPRNPANLAGQEERKIIEHFEMNSEATRWTGEVMMGGKEYYAHFSPRRVQQDCLVCHGRPEDAPADLLARYGPTAGFGWAVGDVNLDTIAFPTERVDAALASQTLTQLLVTGALLALLTGLVVVVFRYTVTRRLAAITGHFQKEAEKDDGTSLTAIEVSGDDEIGVLAGAFNALVRHIKGLHESLEERVRQRTAELQTEIAQRKRAQQERESQLQRVQEYSAAIVNLATHNAIAEGELQAAAAAVNEIVVEAVDVARGSVWLLRHDDSQLVCLDLFERDPREHSAGATLSVTDYPCYFEAFRTRRAIDANDACQDPRTSEFSEGYLIPLGITSVLDAAIRISGKVAGVLCVEHVGPACTWQPEDVAFASEAAGQMAQAILNGERHLAERERRDLEARFQHAQKLESLGVLAGGIAHDFNNLLMAILGNTELAFSEVSPTSPVHQHLTDIEKASRHAADLCRQMLAYSGRGRFEMVAVDLSQLVDEIVHLLRSSISKKIALNLHLEQGLPPVTGDPAQVQQLVMNLVTNASEAIGDDVGTVDIDTGAGHFTTEELGKNLTGEEVPAGEYVFVDVTDSGCGMDEETRQKIFDPFFTTKFAGRGLGLAAVLGIVRAHGGHVNLTSEPGLGTSFTIRFPVGEPRVDAVAEGEAETRNALTGKSILIVEDEKPVQRAVSRILQKAGFETVTADDGEDAVKVYRAQADRFDCVVLDMTMPRMSGEEAFKEMRAIREDLPVVFASGYEDPGVADGCPNQNRVCFLQKPYKGSELVASIRKVLDG